MATPGALRRILALVQLDFPPWEDQRSGASAAPEVAPPRHSGQLGYTALPGGAVVLSEQAWGEEGETLPDAPPEQLVADPGWEHYPEEPEPEQVTYLQSLSTSSSR